MLSNKEYTGIVIEDNLLKVARIKIEKGKATLIKLDVFSLVESLKQQSKDTGSFDDAGFDIDDEADSIFGLEDDLDVQEDDDVVELDALEEEEQDQGEDLLSLDMAEEADTAQSNEILLYNILNDISSKKVRLGLNISAGNTIFQIIRDTNFNEVKKKDLVADLEDKLESIYGMPKSPDNYAYEIRENGSLILASVDEEPAILGLLNQTREIYSGSIFIEDILSDEVILVGLTRANYEFEENQMTGIIQFGQRKCRIVFMRGDEVWLVSPIINEGVKNKGFLNTVFSKILFQLDTGEVPNLDRLIIANNSLGEDATDFFRKNFPDISVEEFQYDEAKFSFGDQDPRSAGGFTTAIGMAWAASGHDKEFFPSLSLIPSYVADRQKIFKLQWHGVILLLLIGLSPVTFNYFYQQNAQQISSMESELDRLNAQITAINPTVNSANQLSGELELIQQKLVLLDTLSSGSQEWSTKMDILNSGFTDIRSSWLTGLEYSDEGMFIDGYTLFRNQIPRIVNIFNQATLLSVNIEEIREQEVYRFSILVREFAENSSAYSPPRPEDLQTILGQ